MLSTITFGKTCFIGVEKSVPYITLMQMSWLMDNRKIGSGTDVGYRPQFHTNFWSIEQGVSI